MQVGAHQVSFMGGKELNLIGAKVSFGSGGNSFGYPNEGRSQLKNKSGEFRVDAERNGDLLQVPEQKSRDESMC